MAEAARARAPFCRARTKLARKRRPLPRRVRATARGAGMPLSGLKIALVGPLPPPHGGIANQTRQLAELLEREGACVTLVAVNSPYWPRWIGGLRGLRAFFRLLPFVRRLWSVAGEVEIFHVMANSGWSWHLFAAPAVWVARLRG